LYAAPPEWASLRRSTDFYDEGWLIWLGVDTEIRALTNNDKSIDDFCKRFHGGASGSPAVSPYTLDDVVVALNQVAPYDWKGFLTARVNRVGGGAPLDGLERAGWKLVYNDTRNDYLKLYEAGEHRTVDVAYSAGLRLTTDGTIVDALAGSPAFAAGLGPGMKVTSVNGKPFSGDVLRAAISAASRPPGLLQLQVDNQGLVKSVSLDYHDGQREPHLDHAGKSDFLASILAPHGR
jgi:predicted metalloprotease with PDZ domain